MALNRRTFLMGAPLVVAGCTTQQHADVAPVTPQYNPSFLSMYAAIDTEPFPVPAIDLKRVKSEFLRKEVAYQTGENPGTIVVDPAARYAHLVMGNGRALRYGVGVGKQEGFNFQGEATIAAKKEWPGWKPTPDMIARD